MAQAADARPPAGGRRRRAAARARGGRDGLLWRAELECGRAEVAADFGTLLCIESDEAAKTVVLGVFGGSGWLVREGGDEGED